MSYSSKSLLSAAAANSQPSNHLVVPSSSFPDNPLVLFAGHGQVYTSDGSCLSPPTRPHEGPINAMCGVVGSKPDDAGIEVRDTDEKYKYARKGASRDY